MSVHVAEPCQMEKWVWTEDEFERMGWHDCQVHALAFSPETSELLFDVDHIFEWLHPEPNETHFKFWVSPVTLVFGNVYDVGLDVGSYIGELESDRISREDAHPPLSAAHVRHDTEWLWTIDCQEGDIRMRSGCYTLCVRASPRLGRQNLELSARGGYSLVRGRTDAP